MTLPDERYRAVLSARELLVEMANSSGRWKRIPKELRLYCIHALRHYPTQYDMQAAATRAPEVFQEKMNPLVRILTMYDNEQKENEMKNIPNVTFAFRQGDEEPEQGGCPIGGEFVFKTSNDLFANKRVVVFSLPGAFTPTCSTYQLPGFENQFNDFKAQGIDEIYCVSVNDAFVMNEWSRALKIKNVKVIPDGAGAFTEGMGMTVDMSAIGFGKRSRRYAAIIDNGNVEQMFVEPESSASDPDPYGVSSPENVMKHLQPQTALDDLLRFNSNHG